MKPIDSVPVPESVPQPVIVDKNAPKCVACGRYHGSVNRGIACVQEALEKSRERIRELEKEIAGKRKVR